MSRSRDRRGQFRAVEATVAAFIIFFSFIAANYLIRNSRVWTVSRSEDLSMLGYNLLHSLDVTGVLNGTVATQRVGWERGLDFALKTFLPSTAYYNLTVYKSDLKEVDPSVGVAELEGVGGIITNTDPDTFSRSPEVISIQYLFTSTDGSVFLLVLQISEARGEFDN